MSYIPSDEIQVVAQEAVAVVLKTLRKPANKIIPKREMDISDDVTSVATSVKTEESPISTETMTSREDSSAITNTPKESVSDSLAVKNDKCDSVEEIRFKIRFLRVAGHLHCIEIPWISQSELKSVQNALTGAIVQMADKAISNAMRGNTELAVALERHGLDPKNIGMVTSDVVLLIAI